MSNRTGFRVTALGRWRHLMPFELSIDFLCLRIGLARVVPTVTVF